LIGWLSLSVAFPCHRFLHSIKQIKAKFNEFVVAQSSTSVKLGSAESKMGILYFYNPGLQEVISDDALKPKFYSLPFPNPGCQEFFQMLFLRDLNGVGYVNTSTCWFARSSFYIVQEGKILKYATFHLRLSRVQEGSLSKAKQR